MRYATEEQKAHRDEWVAALRSGMYLQTREILRDETLATPRYCCLGVACAVAIQHGVLGGFPGDTSEWDEELPTAVRDWLGLASRFGQLVDVASTADAQHLIDLNDHAGYTFAQIADVIESGKVLLAGEQA